MNAERLHAIVNAIGNEISEGDVAALATRLRDNLQQAGNEPGQPAHQTEASAARTALNEALASAPSNNLTPTERETLDELGVADLLGESLRERIESILARNEITPSAAAGELDPLVQRLQEFQAAITNLQNGFAFLGVGADELAPGEFEIDFLIPRDYVSNELEGLGREFLNLKKILGPFQELATGTREDIQIRSISSSAFGAFLQSTPATALILATALERLLASYEKLMNIRVASKTLNDSLEPETLDTIAKDVASKMTREIDAQVKDMLEGAKVTDDARLNELEKELKDALNALANRIDRGYNVGVRAGEIPPPDDNDEDGDETAADRELRATAQQVISKQAQLSFANLSGEPILGLPEKAGGDGQRMSSGE